MWKFLEGRYGLLAYVALGVLALVVVGMLVFLLGTPGWDTKMRFEK